VGTSRVIPRFRHYAPGVDLASSEAGVHAIDLRTGRVLGSLVWPMGNQVFAIEATGDLATIGFPFSGSRSRRQVERLFFSGNAGAARTRAVPNPRRPLRTRRRPRS